MKVLVGSYVRGCDSVRANLDIGCDSGAET